MLVHLQGIGEYPAKKARELKTGDIMVWNYGSTSTMAGIIKETATQLVIKTIGSNGKENQRRIGKETLVAVQGL